MPAAPAPEQESSDAADIALEGVAEEPERNAGSVFESPAVTENPESPAEESSVDTARMRDDGEKFSFSAYDNPKSVFARGWGAATRRNRYTAARTTHRPEHQSIDDMLQEGQEVLVQIAKEPIAKKGARVTSHIALPGRYLVYMPTVDHIGVSRKIGSDAERIRLKDIILRQRNRFPGGVIVRTAAEERSEEELVNDLNFLVRMWEDIRAKADKVSAPSLIHAEMNLVQRLLRDQFSFEFAAIARG
jgi:ribonuclease G